MATSMEIIVGTYEQILIGYRLEETGKEYTLKESFTDHSHSGSIRSVACSSRYLASGSTDETIRIYSLVKRREIGTLMQQEGSINALEFYENFFLFSASEDSTICIFTPKKWMCVKTLRGHEKGITSFSVHPSGKLAMSLSKDCKLRTWNLIKGRAAFITNLKTVGEILKWSPSGGYYVIVKNFIADIYKLETAGIIQTFDFGKKILAVEFIDEIHIAVAGEGGNVEIFAHDRGAITAVFKAHENRIKAMKCINYGEFLWLITVSSDGYIKVWKLTADDLSVKPSLVTEVDTKCRITCMTVATVKCNEQDSVKDFPKDPECEKHQFEKNADKEEELSDSNIAQEIPKKKRIKFEQKEIIRKKKKL